MKLNKIVLSSLSVSLLALTFSACSQSTAVNNSAANTANKANTIASENKTDPAATNSSAANNSVVQSNTEEGKMAVTQATTQEKQEIFQLIKKDKDVSEFLKDMPKQSDKLIESLTVRKMDLNADNQPEFVAVLENDVLCGAHANCPQWIYNKKGGEFNLLRQTRAQAIKLEKTSTKGYLDLRAEGSDSATTNSYVVFKFDGSKYQPDKCVSRDESVKPVKETTIKCQEMGEEIQ